MSMGDLVCRSPWGNLTQSGRNRLFHFISRRLLGTANKTTTSKLSMSLRLSFLLFSSTCLSVPIHTSFFTDRYERGVSFSPFNKPHENPIIWCLLSSSENVREVLIWFSLIFSCLSVPPCPCTPLLLEPATLPVRSVFVLLSLHALIISHITIPWWHFSLSRLCVWRQLFSGM